MEKNIYLLGGADFSLFSYFFTLSLRPGLDPTYHAGLLVSELVFSKWRARLWPIHQQELRKIIPLLLMKCLISLNYSLLTSMKDAMVVTARGGGAEVIPVLKGWGVLPVAIFAAFLYAKLSARLRPTTMFALILFSFLTLIALYGYVLYPNMEALSPHYSAHLLQAWLGE